jgi:hypothetical protein
MTRRRDRVDQRLDRLEGVARELLQQVGQLRMELGRPAPGEETWARQIYDVLSQVARRGGSVPRREFLEIGERAGYERQGMAGFYQQLVTLVGNRTYLTDAGRERLRALEGRFGEPTSAAGD